MPTNDELPPAWEIRTREYAENLEAVKGKEYRSRMAQWIGIAYRIGAHTLKPPSELLELTLGLGAMMKLEEGDMVAALKLFNRIENDARRTQ